MEFCHQFIKRTDYLTKSFTTAKVAFDRYKTKSLKSRTIAKRKSGKAVRYQVIDSTNICGITLKQFLSHVLTKRHLTVFYQNISRISLKILTLNMFYHMKTSLSNILDHSNELQKPDHEEADTC